MKSLEDLEDAFESGLRAWEEEIVKKHAGIMGANIIKEVKRLTPHITGTLKRAWSFKVEIQPGDVIIRICNPVEYAPYVNDGHRIVRGGKTVGKKAGRHMLEEGIQAYQDTHMQGDVEDMLEALKGAMQK